MITLLLVLALLVVSGAISLQVYLAITGCTISHIAICTGSLSSLFELLAEILNALSS